VLVKILPPWDTETTPSAESPAQVRG